MSIKSLITFTINKPILNHILLLFLFLLGIFSYNSIPKELFPPTNLDKVSISGFYVGSSVKTLDNLAVGVIEDELENINGIYKLESTIRNGAFNIIAELQENANKQEVLADIKDAVENIKRDFPNDMDDPTIKLLTTSYPLVAIAISSDNGDLLSVAKELKSDLSSIDNLSDIQIRGDADEELVIRLDIDKIKAYDLDISSILKAIKSSSVTFPIGEIKQKGNHLSLSTINGQKELEKIKNIKINLNGGIVRLSDISTISYEFSDTSTISSHNAQPSISIDINKGEEGNSIDLVKNIKELLKTYATQYKEYKFEVYTDSSIWIRNRLNTVVSNILFGLFLVILAVFIFVSGRIAFIVGMGIPVSFMIGLIATDLMGYSINMLSLLGGLIALGMLVDEAIVVAENIYKHLENGEDPKSAAIKGSVEMFPAVLTATATTIFAFLPLLLMSGEMGVFMKILPIMISTLLLSSLFEAFFFLPLHAKEFLRADIKPKKAHESWYFLKQKYKKILNAILAYPKIIALLMFVIFLGSTIFLQKSTKFQLFPDFDTTQIYISGKVNINNSLEETQQIVSKVEKLLLKNMDMQNEISSITSISGFRLDAKYRPEIGDNKFHIFIDLFERVPQNLFDTYINPTLSPSYDKGRIKRVNSADELKEQIQQLVLQLNQNQFEELQVITPKAGIVKNDLEIALSGDELKVQQGLEKLQKKLESIDGVSNIGSDLKPGKRELKLELNSYAQTLGVTEGYIFEILRPLFFKSEVAKMFKDNELIDIKTEHLNKDQISSLKNFLLPLPDGTNVALYELVEFNYVQNDEMIFKTDGLKQNSIFASLNKSKITSAEVLKELTQSLAQIKDLGGVEIQIKGEQQENDKLQIEMMQIGLIALFLIFISLVWMFDSLLLSSMVLLNIPLSVFGALLGHFLMGLNITMPSMLGIIGLAGVVVNDGIIMLDFIKKSKNKEKVIELALLRLRPIILTSITTILGLSSLIFFASGQALILQPMAISLGFGLLWATVLNLIFLPTLYFALKDIKENTRNLFQKLYTKFTSIVLGRV